MCAGIHHPTRGGTRGGKDQFDWDEVKTDKDRECYLGHSVMAPVGRWQKGKDLSWYTKKSKSSEYKAILEAERAAVKQAEEEAMAAALGLKPSVKPQQPLSKQEAAEVFRRQSQTDNADGEERMKGVGFRGKTLSRPRTDSTSHNLTAIFEHDTSQDVAGSVPQGMVKETSDITSSSTNSRRELRAKLKAYLEKKATRVKSKKKKFKKEKRLSKDKHRRRRTPSTSSSDSSEGEWVEAVSSNGTHRLSSKPARQSSDVSHDKHPGTETHRQKKGDGFYKDTSRHYSKHHGDDRSLIGTRSRDYHRNPSDTRSRDHSHSPIGARSHDHSRRKRDSVTHRTSKNVDNLFSDSSNRERTSKSGRKTDDYDLSTQSKRWRGS